MNAKSSTPNTVRLSASDASGKTTHHELSGDSGAFIGTSANCGFRLQGTGLSDIHCRIGFEGGTLWIQDWMSAGGTFVNGQEISSRIELSFNDEIRLGEVRITLSQHQSATHSPQDATARSSVPAAEPTDRSPNPATARDESTLHAAVGQSVAESETESLPDDLDDEDAIEFDFDFDLQDEQTYDHETVALLHAEIQDLQAALAQSDAERKVVSDDGYYRRDAAVLPREEPQPPDSVMVRMQELIEEANRSDERVALLEELLHTAEDANRCEQEERAQLEAWVTDIEKRVSQREQEHAGEIAALKQRLEQAEQQQETLRKRLQQAAQCGAAPAQYEANLDTLQAANQKLQQRLAESEQSRMAAEQRLENVRNEQDQALREERANIAKEQANLSRLRFELSSKLADVEELPKTDNPVDRETAHRIQTLREHLREIHQQEKLRQKQASLASRLTSLWKRVEY